MNAETLSMIAGTLLSLGFSYIPGLNNRFDSLSPEYKRLIMLALVLISAIGIYAVSCAGVDFGLSIACDSTGVVSLARLVIMAAIANQGAYGLTKRS